MVARVDWDHEVAGSNPVASTIFEAFCLFFLFQFILPYFTKSLDMTIELITPIAIEQGLRFAIREGGKTVGSGVVADIIE